MQGYFLAAFLFLGIVFSLPVCMGTAALALNLPVSNDEALGGLVLPAAAFVILGKGGEHFVCIGSLVVKCCCKAVMSLLPECMGRAAPASQQ